MDSPQSTQVSRLDRPWRAFLWGGVLAGILDITAACVQSVMRGVSPPRVLRAIASGVMGPTAFQGGAAVACLGLFLHFVIAFGAAALFVIAARQWRALVKYAVLTGALYGVAVYLVMRFIVVPGSAFPARPRDSAIDGVQLTIHIFCVGLPIALAARRFIPTERKSVETSVPERRTA